MKKKVLSMFIGLGIVLLLTACSITNTCKESGCDDEIYEEGYCKYHYYLNAGNEFLKDIIN